MSKSKIEWTEKTWNPVTGCAKVSAGCKNCYAERDWCRLSANPKTVYFGRKFTDVMCHPERLLTPFFWKKPAKVFVNSMSDLFHEDASDRFILDVFGTMATLQQHTFQILTKRPERMKKFLDSISETFFKNMPLPNVWLGVSVEDQKTADERIPLLLDTPAAVRWVSVEPLLSKIFISPFLVSKFTQKGYLNGNAFIMSHNSNKLDWVVVGGESGSKARPMHPYWVRSIRDQCKDAGVPFLFKQWGSYAPISTTTGAQILPFGQYNTSTGFGFKKVNKKAAGRLLDGVLHDEYPEKEG